jgi:oxygen-independent coproporphyrinogen-3 oxidase
MGLRLDDGIDLAPLSARFGLPAHALLDPGEIARHAELGFVWQDGSRVGVTEAGMGLLDALLARLVADGLVAA